MALQKRDYKRALVLWRDLDKRCPNDPVITSFKDYLPAEAKAQDQDEEDEGEYDEEGDEEGDDDYDEEEEKESSEESDGE